MNLLKITKRSAQNRLLLLAFILLFAALGSYLLISSFAASTPDLYIAQSPAGLADGSSCSNAKDVTFFNTSTNWGTNSNQIGPGTTVHLCGTISTSLTAQGSGVSGSPITVLWESGASLSQVSCPQSGCFNTANHSYLTLDGGTNGSILSTANGTELANQHHDVWGISAFNCTGCTIKNLNISNMYVMVGAINVTANTTNGSAAVTGVSSFTGINPNCSNLTGPGISGQDSVIASNPGAGTITLQNPATATANGAVLIIADGCGNVSTGEHAIAYSGSNITITDNTMHDDGWAIDAQEGCTDSNINISGNNVYNSDHDLALTIYNSANCSGGTNLGPIYVYGNHFHDYSNWDTPGGYYHHDGIHCYSSGAGGTVGAHYSGLYIYNNLFDGATDLPGSPFGDNATAQIYLEGPGGGTGCQDSTSTVWIFNNFLTAKEYLNNGLIGANPPVTEVNNTMVGPSTSAGLCLGAGGSKTENNIMTTCNVLISDGNNGNAAMPFTLLDHNIYANGGNNSFVWGGNGSNAQYLAFSQFPLWQSYSGGDSHSTTIANAMVNADGSLQSGSPAIGAGANLTSACSGQPNPGLGALCSDINGTARPATGPWDIGAYQYSSTPQPVVGDLNADGHVNIFDLSIFLSHWQQTGTGLPEDFNTDSIVNIFDLSILLSHYGT